MRSVAFIGIPAKRSSHPMAPPHSFLKPPLPRVNPPVCQAFPGDSLKCGSRAFLVRGLTMRKSEIEFGAIPLKVLLADMVIGADKAALEKPEERFDRVDMNVSASVFTGKV